MSLSDLTGTSWVLNSSLTSYAGGTYTIKTYNVNITSAEATYGLNSVSEATDTFSSVSVGYNSGPESNQCSFVGTNNRTYIWASGNDTKSLPDTWSAYLSIPFTIAGGTDATNANLIAWLESNATISVPTISKITALDGVTYFLKDTVARDSVPTRTSQLINDSYFITSNDVKYKIYNAVGDIGFSSGSATLAQVFSALIGNGMLICSAAQFASGECPSTYGVVQIVKSSDSSRSCIFFYGKTQSDGDYRMFLNGSSAPTGTWIRAGEVQTGSVTLVAANWSGSGPYTQTVSGLTVTSNSKVDIQPDATAIQQMIDDEVYALYIENNSGTLTAYAIGAALTANVTVQVTITEVS